MFIIRVKCAICERLHDVRNKNCRIRQQKMKKTRSTKVDDISFFSVKQTSIRFVVLLCSQSLEIHSSLSSVERDEYLASQNDFQNDLRKRISCLESASSKSVSESASSKSVSESTSSKSVSRSASSESVSESASSESALCSFVVVFVVVHAVAFAVLFVITFVDVFIQHLMISLLISSAHLN